MRSRNAGHARSVVLATLSLVVLTCAYTWPLPLHFRGGVPHDLGDPLLVTWILWWSTQAVPLTAAWWNAPAFHPAGGVLAFSEHLLGLAPITMPAIAATHSPVLAYNLAFVLSFVFSGLAAYGLAFLLTRRHGPAFVAGIAFAFSPYRLSHANHLQLLSSYWVPVSIAALHLYAAKPRWRWAALFALSWLMQALACGYYFFFLSLMAVIWLAWFAAGHDRAALSAGRWAPLATCWVLALAGVAPILAGYQRIQSEYGFRRSPVEIARYSADLAGIATAPPDSLLWGRLQFTSPGESALFPGVTLPIILLAGIVSAARRNGSRPHPWLPFYLFAAALMWTLALGPRPHWLDTPLGIPGPYRLLMWLPGFDGIRVPARLWMLGLLCLGTAAAMMLSRIENDRARHVAVACATIGLLLDGWPRTVEVIPVPAMRVTRANGTARLGLPLPHNETETMYGAIAQARPVVNGYSGYEAPQHAALRYLLEQHDTRIVDRLAASAPIEVLVQRSLDPGGEWSAWMRAHAAARQVEETNDWVSFEVAPTGAVAAPAPSGSPLTISSIAASVNDHDIGAVLDGDLFSRWYAAQAGNETITVTLDRSQRVDFVVMSLGTYASQFPRRLDVSVSDDGARWTAAWSGSTALEAYDGAVRDPRRLPIVLPIHRDGVRYVRLHQTAHAPAAGWTIVELKVLG